MTAKFRDNAALALPAAEVEALERAISALEQQADAATIGRILVRATARMASAAQPV